MGHAQKCACKLANAIDENIKIIQIDITATTTTNAYSAGPTGVYNYASQLRLFKPLSGRTHKSGTETTKKKA